MSIRYSFSIIAVLMFILLVATSTSPSVAFVMPSSSSSSSTVSALSTRQSSSSSSSTKNTSTLLAEQRRWNFNEGQSPWGLKTNAEIWNGRVAQVRVVYICKCYLFPLPHHLDDVLIVIYASFFCKIIAQVAFVIVFIQELIQGKGVIQGVTDGDPINLAILGAVVVSTIGLTGFLALQGDDDYVNKSN